MGRLTDDMMRLVAEVQAERRGTRVRRGDGAKAAAPPVSRKTSRAEWLLWLEHEDERISQALHDLTWKRQQYREEARSLRTALTAEDRALYDTLRSMRAAAVMPSASIVEESGPRGH